MAKKAVHTPNTHLGAVRWWRDMYFGKLLYVCQGLLGFDPKDGHDYHFINSKEYGADDLREFFQEIELKNGMLGLELYMDESNMNVLATIETTLPYGKAVADQVFLNLVEDFVEYVRSLPLGKPGEDPCTEEEMAGAVRCFEKVLGPLFERIDEATKTARQSTDEKDDIPF